MATTTTTTIGATAVAAVMTVTGLETCTRLVPQVCFFLSSVFFTNTYFF